MALAIKITSKGPIFFLQERLGRYGKLFKVYKFRTMVVGAAKKGTITKGNDKRVTKVGKFLRKYRLDEFPQLINVIKGEMSLVGPRPLVSNVAKDFPEEFSYRLQVKPGITGLAAIRLYNREEFLLTHSEDPMEAYMTKIMPQKLRYDIIYVRKYSLWLDMLILWWTAKDFLSKTILLLAKLLAKKILKPLFNKKRKLK